MPNSNQVAAIPVRRQDDGKLEVLLVTSRETRRWIVPKGWPWPEVSDHEAAAAEAWEEGGVRGRILPDKLGTFPVMTSGVTAFSSPWTLWSMCSRRPRKTHMARNGGTTARMV